MNLAFLTDLAQVALQLFDVFLWDVLVKLVDLLLSNLRELLTLRQNLFCTLRTFLEITEPEVGSMNHLVQMLFGV